MHSLQDIETLKEERACLRERVMRIQRVLDDLADQHAADVQLSEELQKSFGVLETSGHILHSLSLD